MDFAIPLTSLIVLNVLILVKIWTATRETNMLGKLDVSIGKMFTVTIFVLLLSHVVPFVMVIIHHEAISRDLVYIGMV